MGRDSITVAAFSQSVVFDLDRVRSDKQDRRMMNRISEDEQKGPSKRWEQGLIELAQGRGDAVAVGQRAVALARDLNIAPWIALAVAERILPLKEVQLIDRAARCKEMQAAVLDKKMSVAQMKVAMPYAPYLLAAELMPTLPGGLWTLRELTEVLKAILRAEHGRDEKGESLPVRMKTTSEYAAMVNRMMALMKETGCGRPMALDMVMGRMTESFVRDYAAHRRLLERESRARMLEERGGPCGYPPRRGSEAGSRFPERSSGSGDYGRRSDAPGRFRRPVGDGRGGGVRNVRPDRRQTEGDSRARTPGG